LVQGLVAVAAVVLVMVVVMVMVMVMVVVVVVAAAAAAGLAHMFHRMSLQTSVEGMRNGCSWAMCRTYSSDYKRCPDR
jgi:hypothetical protein